MPTDDNATGPAGFDVGPGMPLTAFALGPLIETPFAGTAAPMPDWQAYDFRNGFVDVPEMPCRKALRAELAARGVPEIEPFSPVALNLPGISRRLEFSGFWHEPTRLARWARTRIVTEAGGELDLALHTCGGLHLWLDGVHVAGFEPYSRNHLAEAYCQIALPPGGAVLTLLMEEMAERDTNFLAGLTHAGGPSIRLEPCDGLAPARARDLAALAAGLRPAAHVFAPEARVTLVSDHAPGADVPITAHATPSDHLTHHPPLASFTACLRRGETDLDLGDAACLPDGYHPLVLDIGEGAHRVERRIAIARMAEPPPDWPDDLEARKRLALIHAATHGEPRAGRLLAHLALCRDWDATCEAILDDTCLIVNRRKDCADFVLVPLLWIVARHGDALPETAAAKAREAILGFRYWMDEPGNDVMWFWSENHALCFHVSQLLAGRAFPDESFANSGRTGQEHAARAARRLRSWFDAVEADGLAEWNSAAYYPIDFIGLFALHALAEGEIRARATSLIDRIFEMLALHTVGGVSAGSMGRAYDKELKAGPLPELAPFAAVAWGGGWRTRGVAALPMFAASDYVPPEGLGALLTPPPGTAIEAGYCQGAGQAGRLHLWKLGSGQMSVGSGGAPGAGGHQQHVIDVQAAADPFARLWINHPGEDDPFGSARPSHWAGNGILPAVGADGPGALLFYRLGEGAERPYTHAYAPQAAFDEVVAGEDWRVLRSGRGVIVLKATGPLTAPDTGPGAGRELRLDGTTGGWMVRVAELGTGGLAALVAQAEAMALTIDAPGRALTLNAPGEPPLTLRWGAGLYRGADLVPGPPDTTQPRIRTHPS